MGEAARALGASITASGVGGIIGAVVLAVSIPLLEPVVLRFGPSEFFLVVLLVAIVQVIQWTGDRITRAVDRR